MKTIGLALGGGGVTGCAHIGVLKALEESGFPVHMLAGTSSGSMVAALYGCGYTPARLESLLPRINRRTLDYNLWGLLAKLIGRNVTVRGLVKGKRLHRLLIKLIGDRKMKDLDLPLAILSTDLKQARPVIFASRPLPDPPPGTEVVMEIRVADAVLASCSIPVIFPPVHLQGRVLVDGGLLHNCPVRALKGMGADRVIAVDLTRAAPEGNTYATLTDILQRVVSINLADQTRRQIHQADVVLTPEVNPVNILDFPQTRHCVKVGYSHARKRMHEILPLMETEKSP